MVRVIGIDPGTVSFDVCGLEDGRLFLDVRIPSSEVAAAPEVLVDLLRGARLVDLIAGPSGYGLPLVPIGRLDERDLALLVLMPPAADERPAAVGGLRRLVRALRQADLPVVLTPGVIHLPTVPLHRKVNRIDLGTADKLCVVALAIADQARRLGLAYDETSFVLVELGGAFSAVIGVDGGQVVDGVGGTSGPIGLRALGALDGELAFLLGKVTKTTLFRGGALDVAGLAGSPTAADEFLHDLATRNQAPGTEYQEPETGDRRPETRSPRSALAWSALFESVERAVAGILAAVGETREIVLSGRLAQQPAVRAEMLDRLAKYAPARPIGDLASQAKSAAQGAALIADGLAGGRYAVLVETMQLRRAAGTVLDYLYVPERETIRAAFGLCAS